MKPKLKKKVSLKANVSPEPTAAPPPLSPSGHQVETATEVAITEAAASEFSLSKPALTQEAYEKLNAQQDAYKKQLALKRRAASLTKNLGYVDKVQKVLDDFNPTKGDARAFTELAMLNDKHERMVLDIPAGPPAAAPVFQLNQQIQTSGVFEPDSGPEPKQAVTKAATKPEPQEAEIVENEEPDDDWETGSDDDSSLSTDGSEWDEPAAKAATPAEDFEPEPEAADPYDDEEWPPTMDSPQPVPKEEQDAKALAAARMKHPLSGPPKHSPPPPPPVESPGVPSGGTGNSLSNLDPWSSY